MRKTQLLRIDKGKNSLKYREFINTYLKIMKSQKTTKHGEFYNVSHRFASLNMRFGRYAYEKAYSVVCDRKINQKII